MQDRLTKLVGIFEGLDFRANRAHGDDLLMANAYEYLMGHFATQSGKSKGQFYTPAEVSRIMARGDRDRPGHPTGSHRVRPDLRLRVAFSSRRLIPAREVDRVCPEIQQTLSAESFPRGGPGACR